MKGVVIRFRRSRRSSAKRLQSLSAISKMSPASSATQLELRAIIDRQQKLALANPRGARQVLKAFAALLTLSGV